MNAQFRTLSDGGESVQDVMDALRDTFFATGTTESLSLSLCVLYYQLKQHVPETCRCIEQKTTTRTVDAQLSAAGTSKFRSFNVRGASTEMTMTELQLKRMQRMRELDEWVYARALTLMYDRAREVELMTGVPLICTEQRVDDHVIQTDVVESYAMQKDTNQFVQ